MATSDIFECPFLIFFYISLKTPLHCSIDNVACKNDVGISKLLLTARADVNARDYRYGACPLLIKIMPPKMNPLLFQPKHTPALCCASMSRRRVQSFVGRES
jgi:hypothetical protein